LQDLSSYVGERRVVTRRAIVELLNPRDNLDRIVLATMVVPGRARFRSKPATFGTPASPPAPSTHPPISRARPRTARPEPSGTPVPPCRETFL